MTATTTANGRNGVVGLDNSIVVEGFHPLAEASPRMPKNDFDALAADIAANGLHEPIDVYENRILDGRERYEACNQADVAARFRVYGGDDPAGYVISQNVHRRHMSSGARGMAAALTLQAAGRRKDGRWVRGSVDIAKFANNASAWQTAMHKAGVILDYGGALLADLVATDQWSLDRAYQYADALRRVKPERSAEAKAAYAAAFKAYSECAAEYAAKGEELEKLGEALAAASADAAKEDRKGGRKKKSAESPDAKLAKAIGLIAAYGRVGDPDTDGFNPDDLDPPLLARHFAAPELADALCGVNKFVDWQARRDAQ